MTVAYFVCNDLAFFDSDLAENYVTFGSDHQKVVGNPNGYYEVTAAPCSGTSILHMSTVTFCQLLSNISIDLKLEYIFGKATKCRIQQCTEML